MKTDAREIRILGSWDRNAAAWTEAVRERLNPDTERAASVLFTAQAG